MHDEYLSQADILDVARRVLRVHGDGTCLNCTPDGCVAEEWAAVTLFDDAVAAASTGAKSLDDVRRVADQIRGVAEGVDPSGAGVDRGDRTHLNRTIGRAPG